MDKEKEFAKMAVIANEYDCSCKCEECWRNKINECSAIAHAELLYNAGYRKADEVRKETAKEILQKLSKYEAHMLGSLCFYNGQPIGRLSDLVKKLVEEYNVEVDE